MACADTDLSGFNTEPPSVERDADPLLLTPDHTTCPLRLLALNQEHESIGNVQRGRDFQGCARFRDVTDGALEFTAAELDRASFQHTST